MPTEMSNLSVPWTTYTVATLTFVHEHARFQQFVVVGLEWSSVTLGFRVRMSCSIGPTCHARHVISCSLLLPQVSHARSVNVTQEKMVSLNIFNSQFRNSC